MTLNISISRAGAYALGASDKGVYLGWDGMPDGEYQLLPGVKETDKTVRLTNYVLAQCGGCRFIQADFRRLMAERVAPDDDLTACEQTAREVVEWLLENDRPGERYPWPDCPSGIGERMSVAEGEFTVKLIGFRRDGSSAISQWQKAGEMGVDGWESFDDPEQGEYTTSKPYGVPLDSVAPFFGRLIEAPVRAADAFAYAWAFTRELYEAHPDRITSEMCGYVVLWRAGGPATMHFDCDALDFEEATGICVQLRGIQDALAAVDGEITAS